MLPFRHTPYRQRTKRLNGHKSRGELGPRLDTQLTTNARLRAEATCRLGDQMCPARAQPPCGFGRCSDRSDSPCPDRDLQRLSDSSRDSVEFLVTRDVRQLTEGKYFVDLEDYQAMREALDWALERGAAIGAHGLMQGDMDGNASGLDAPEHFAGIFEAATERWAVKAKPPAP